MRNVRILVLLLTSSLGFPIKAEDTQTNNLITYTGAWFKVAYPTNFVAVPLIRSQTAKDGFDAVRFIEPKEMIEFYVYSPQAGGFQEDYQKELSPDPAKEILEKDVTISKNYVVQGKIIQTNALTERVILISAKDKSYVRTFEISEDYVQATRLIFGFRYPNALMKENYGSAYGAFKRSLVQYAD